MARNARSFRMASLVAVLALALGIMAGCVQSAPNATSTGANAVSEQQVGGVSQTMTGEASKQLEAEMSAFELTALQREQAKGNERGYEVLDAGRGNPNWINAKGPSRLRTPDGVRHRRVGARHERGRHGGPCAA